MCIIHFVALEVVIEIPKIYFESMHSENKLIEVYDHHVIVEKSGKEIKFFKDRGFNNQI